LRRIIEQIGAILQIGIPQEQVGIESVFDGFVTGFTWMLPRMPMPLRAVAGPSMGITT